MSGTLRKSSTMLFKVARNSFLVTYLVYLEEKQLKLYFADRHEI